MNEPTVNDQQPSSQPEQPALDLSKVTKGCTLRSKRGATAKVVSVETKQGSKDRKPFALNVIIKEDGKERSAKLLPFAQAGWSLWKTAEQIEAEEEAQSLLAQPTTPVIAENEITPVVISTDPVAGFARPCEECGGAGSKISAVDGFTRPCVHCGGTGIFADDDPVEGRLIPDEELEPDDMEPLNPERKEIDRLQAEVEDLQQQLETTRQALTLNHESYTALQEEWLKAHEELHEADNAIVQLTAALDATREQRDSAIEQLDEANKLIESHNERAAAGLEALSLTESPIKEFTILTKVLTGDLARMDKEGWNVEYMQFSEGGDLRAVYSRFCRPAPAPQPERTAAKVVTPNAVIFETPATQPDPAEVALEEAELIGVHARAAAKASPLPRFSAEAYMRDAFEASMEAAAKAGEDRQPLYHTILNYPTALPAQVVRPS